MNRRDFLAAAAAAPAFSNLQTDFGFTSLFDGKSLDGWKIARGPESAFYVDDGCIVGSPSAEFPAWLRTERQYENFDFRCEFFVRGWTSGGIYIHAPEHGRTMWVGKQVKIFHQQDDTPMTNSMGSIFPVIAPRQVEVRSQGEWNQMRILADWPSLRVWVNETIVQDLNMETHPQLKYRLRSGFIGLSTLNYPLRFRNLRIQELPRKEEWEVLYQNTSDMEKWFISESSEHAPAQFDALGSVIRADGSGHLATKEKYRDFQLHLYIRGDRHHNGGVLVRSAGEGLKGPSHYEIQLHDVEEAHYPTGSLYHFKRAIYPRIETGKWSLMQLLFRGNECVIRVNGETVLEYEGLENQNEGHIELQAHRPGKWIEFKDIQVKRL